MDIKKQLWFTAAFESLEGELLTPEEIDAEVDGEVIIKPADVSDVEVEVEVETTEEVPTEVEVEVESTEEAPEAEAEVVEVTEETTVDADLNIDEVTVGEVSTVTEEQVIDTVTDLEEVTESLEEIIEQDDVADITEAALESYRKLWSLVGRNYGVDVSAVRNIIATESFATQGSVTRKKNAIYAAEAFREVIANIKTKFNIVEIQVI